MSITLSKLNSNRRAAPGCNIFDYVESHVYFISLYFRTKFQIVVRLIVIIAKEKIAKLIGRQMPVDELFDHPST